MLPAGGSGLAFLVTINFPIEDRFFGDQELRLLVAIMPRIGVDKQTGIQVAMKSWWINGTLFGSNGIGTAADVEIEVDMWEERD